MDSIAINIFLFSNYDFYRDTLLCALIFCYIIIKCETRKYLVKSKSNFFLVDTITGSSSGTKHRNLNVPKRRVLGQEKKYPTNILKNNDYNDLLTKQRNLNKQGKKHRRRKNYAKNGSSHNAFGTDYNDMQNKNRNLGGQKRKQGRGFGRKKHSKNQSINNDLQTKHGQEWQSGRGLGQRATYSKNGSINSSRKHRVSFRKKEKYAKNDYNEFGNDYNNGWLSK